MTIRRIATAANLPNTDGIVKAWNLLNIGRHPGLDADLPADHAALLLSYLSQPITRRKPHSQKRVENNQFWKVCTPLRRKFERVFCCKC